LLHASLLIAELTNSCVAALLNARLAVKSRRPSIAATLLLERGLLIYRTRTTLIASAVSGNANDVRTFLRSLLKRACRLAPINACLLLSL